MRIALFGGTFDPPHRGHLAIAHAAMARLRLDRVLMAPAGVQPLKRDLQTTASYAERLEMVRLAVADEPGIEASTIDAPRSDGKPNYTIDTIHRLRDGLEPGDRLFCLVGADSFLTLKKWYRAAELLLNCGFIVAGRPGFRLGEVAAALPRGLAIAGRAAEVSAERETFTLVSPMGGLSELFILPDLQVDISATQIRAALADGTAAKSLLAPQVVEYIERRGLYR